MKYLHLFLCSLLFGSGAFVSLSKTSIESVLFLILTFCNAAAILFLLNVEFLGLIFIIIYVGAIAVLFLFVIMMLNVKTEEQNIFSSKDADLQKTLTKFIILNIFLILSASSVYLFLGNVFLENELYIFQVLYNNICTTKK